MTFIKQVADAWVLDKNGSLRFSVSNYESALVRLREDRIATHSTPADRIADA
jgi:hypothetical protein